VVSTDDSLGGGRLQPGERIAGKYEILEVLGEGGMGIVYVALHTELNEHVAIKMLHPKRAGDQEVVARFVREGRTSVKIRSEHVARVLDVGTHKNGIPYIVMEYLAGEDLGQRIDRAGALPVPVAVDFVLQTCEALAVAHAMGVVHRDLKPSNLFVSEGSDGLPFVKVLDFGISKAADAVEHGVTTTSDVLGSPGYMSPEQMRATRDVDSRADIWSLGMILWEMLVGAPMFGGATFPEVCSNVLNGKFVPLGDEAKQAIPEGLAAVVDRCLSLEPSARFATVKDLADALAPFAGPDAAARVARIARLARPTSDARRASSSVRPPALAATMPATPASSDVTTSKEGPPRRDPTPPPWNSGPPPANKPVLPYVLAALVAVAAVGLTVGLWPRARSVPLPEPVVASAPPATTPSASSTSTPQIPPSATASAPSTKPGPTSPPHASTSTPPAASSAPAPPPSASASGHRPANGAPILH